LGERNAARLHAKKTAGKKAAGVRFGVKTDNVLIERKYFFARKTRFLRV
jgi:hypothetical protein